MKIILKLMMFIGYVVLAVLSKLVWFAIEIASRFFVIYFFILGLGLVLCLINKTWDSLKAVGVCAGLGVGVLFAAATVDASLEIWRDALKERLFARG